VVHHRFQLKRCAWLVDFAVFENVRIKSIVLAEDTLAFFLLVADEQFDRERGMAFVEM